MNEIRTERLTLRPIAAADWRDMQAIMEDFCKGPYRIYDNIKDTRDAAVQDMARRWAEASENPDHRFFAVCLEGRMIGYFAFNRIPAEDAEWAGFLETGYCFLSEFHGKGYAREALEALLQLLKDRGEKKIVAGTALKNLPSCRLLDALGFRLTGTELLAFHEDEEGRPLMFFGGRFERDL